eukprot:CAMPEP_0181522248 /NCGR_PEP_ID=MMETSP1110-20121109/67272_1 /TAXON_ID=174948 /ORGANISM="Symbiodinium sp., Strain CCMP421" /LENGTH=128 /DNA_ID=CAMNT_0023652851 /DNA_START=38 /DNA_END=421 /DNA_ORIENTATION=+
MEILRIPGARVIPGRGGRLRWPLLARLLPVSFAEALSSAALAALGGGDLLVPPPLLLPGLLLRLLRVHHGDWLDHGLWVVHAVLELACFLLGFACLSLTKGQGHCLRQLLLFVVLLSGLPKEQRRGGL